MVAEKGISVHIVQITLRWMREAPFQSIYYLCGIEAKQLIQPVLDRVVFTISNWFRKLDFGESAVVCTSTGSCLLVDDTLLVLLSKRLEQLQ
jgi:hypothetical protein